MALPLLALQKGLINLGAGTYPAGKVIHCEADGGFTITWDDNTTTPYTMVIGDDRAIYEAKLIEITSGTFTMARQ